MKRKIESVSLKLPTVRNPFVVLAMNKSGAGSHRKSQKAIRCSLNVKTKNSMDGNYAY